MIISRSRGRRRIRTNIQMKLDERETEAEREAAFERELERDAAAWANGSAGRQKLWDQVQKWRKFNKRELPTDTVKITRVAVVLEEICVGA